MIMAMYIYLLQCNNPLTKEPKLTAAARIVPEWTTYDLEVKGLWDKVYKSKKSNTSTKISKEEPTKKEEL